MLMFNTGGSTVEKETPVDLIPVNVWFTLAVSYSNTITTNNLIVKMNCKDILSVDVAAVTITLPATSTLGSSSGTPAKCETHKFVVEIVL